MATLRPSRAAPRARLAQLGLSLPTINPPAGSSVPAVRSGNMVYVAGQLPVPGGRSGTTGKVGAEVSAETAARLAGECVLSALAAIDTVADLDEVGRVVRAVVYVACAEGFTGTSRVIAQVDGLLESVFGDAAQCAAVGVPCLPLDSPVEAELTAELSPR